PTTYDLAGLQEVHQHLFQDVYPWAGEIRTIEITKGSTAFAAVSDIDELMSVFSGRIESTDQLRTVSDAEFHMDVAYLLTIANYSHPFREGNGRAQRAFLTALAAESGRGLAWDLLDQDLNDIASALSADSEFGPITGMIGAIAHHLDEPPPTTLLGARDDSRFGDPTTRTHLEHTVAVINAEKTATSTSDPDEVAPEVEVLERARSLQARSEAGHLTLEDAAEADRIAQGPNTGPAMEVGWSQEIAEDVVDASEYSRYGYGYGYAGPGRGIRMDAPAPEVIGHGAESVGYEAPDRAL
ncbi:MAG: Fic family protein, partial [Propionibacteriaceae bacterium]|nr:Fic family protein [Propionibacteriaceae bacterium]